jgi:predicted N-acetyltransferase YhbS
MEIRLCKPEEIEQSWALERMVWAEFNWEAEGSTGTDYFPDLHLVAVDQQGKLLATIDACPLVWDGDKKHLPKGGWAEMVNLASAGFDGKNPEWVGVIGASIHPDHSQDGLSSKMLTELKKQALGLGYKGLVAPVRPIYRARSPQISLAQYVQLRLPDGEHFDPWVRVHERLNGKIIGYCHGSATFEGTREQWEKWLGMKLPEKGKILAPKTIGWLKLSDGKGYLSEDSIWILHQ